VRWAAAEHAASATSFLDMPHRMRLPPPPPPVAGHLQIGTNHVHTW
jgi:hypothetical protein